MLTMTRPVVPAAGFVAARGSGETFAMLGSLVTILVPGEATNDAFSLSEHRCPAGFGVPMHLHRLEDEALYVLEGGIHGQCDGEPFRAGPGDVAVLPRGVPHAFAVEGDRPARILVLTTPAGFERFCREAGSPAATTIVPPAPPTAADVERMLAAAARYGLEMLPPE